MVRSTNNRDSGGKVTHASLTETSPSVCLRRIEAAGFRRPRRGEAGPHPPPSPLRLPSQPDGEPARSSPDVHPPSFSFPIARTNLTSGVDKPRDFVWSLGCIGKATLSEASSKRSIVRPYQVPKKTEQRNGQASNTTNRLVLWSSAKASSWEVL